MKPIFEMLVLNPREQRVVVAIVLIVMLSVAVVHHRRLTEDHVIPQFKTMDASGTVKTRLTDGAGRTPVDREPK
jgi:hypothetical protein